MAEVIYLDDATPAPVGDASYQYPQNATDDTAAILAFADQMRAARQQFPFRPVEGRVRGAHGFVLRDNPSGPALGLDFTNIPGLTLRGVPGFGNARSGFTLKPGPHWNAVVADFTGSVWLRFVDLNWQFDAGNVNTVGLLCAAVQGGEAGPVTLERTIVSGPLVAPLYALGVEYYEQDQGSWLVVNTRQEGGTTIKPTSAAALWLVNENVLGVASLFHGPIHAGPFGHCMQALVDGGFVWNNAPDDAYALALAGVRGVTLRRANLIGREAGIKIVGSGETGMLVVDDNTRFSSNTGGFLRYVIRDDAATITRGVDLRSFEAAVSEAVYGTPYQPNRATVSLKTGTYRVNQPSPGSPVPLVSMPGPPPPGASLWLSELECMDIHGLRHPVNVGGQINETNRLYNPGPISAPGGDFSKKL